MNSESIFFKIGADTKDFDKGLENVQKTLDSLNRRASKVNQSLQKSVSSFSVPKGQKMDFLQATGIDIKTMQKAVNTLPNQMRGKLWESVLKEMGGSWQKFIASLEKTRVSKPFQDITAGMRMTQVEAYKSIAAANAFRATWSEGIQSLSKMSSSLWVMSMGMKQFGQAMLFNFTLPIAAAGAGIFKLSSDFEKSADQIQASAGVYGEAGEKFQTELTDRIKAMSLVMPETIDNLMNYAYAATQAGVSAENGGEGIARFAQVMAQLKAVEKDYTGTAKELADMLAKTSLAFGIQFENVDHVASAMRAASKSIPGGMNEIAAAMVRASGGAGTFNVSFATTLGMVTTILPLVGSASRAGTQLENIYSKAAENYDKMAKRLGMSNEEMKAQMDKNLSSVIQNYLGRLSNVASATDVTNEVMSMFGEETGKVVIRLINNFDDLTANIAEMNSEFENATTLADDYSVATDNIASTFQKFKNAINVLAIEIGESLNGALGEFLDKLIGAIQYIIAFWNSMSAGAQKAVVSITGLAAIIGPLVLIFEKLFISPIAGLVTFTGKLGKLVITTGLLEKAALRAGVAQAVLNKQTNLGVFSMLKLSFSKSKAAASGGFLSTVIAGLGGTFRAILPILARFLGVVGIIITVLGGLKMAFDKNIFGIKDKINSIVDLKGFGAKKKEISEAFNLKSQLREVEESIREKTGKINGELGGAGDKMVEIAGSWGSKIVKKYVENFSEVDMGVFKQGTDILQQLFSEMEKLGKISGEQMYALGTRGRELMAKAILEAKKLGNVTSETKQGLIDLAGKARVGSIIDSIRAAIKVDKLQSALDKVKSSLESLQSKAKEVIDAITDKIRAQQKADKAEEKVLEDRISELDKQIRASQKAQKEELKPIEERIDIEKDALDDAKDILDERKKANAAEIKVLKDEQRAQERNLSNAQKQLDALKKLRDKYVKIANGMVEYYKMNLNASQRNLELETAMGRDEFDLSWRTARERAIIAEQQVSLAEEQLAIVERSGEQQADSFEAAVLALRDYIDNQANSINSQISLREQEIESLQTNIDLIKENIDIKESLFDAEEAVLQAAVDSAQERLDIQTELAEEIKEKWEAIIDPLQELKDTESEALDDMRTAHQDYIDLLEEEKDALQEKYDKEIEIEQAKVDAAEKSLKAAQDSLDRINKLNSELLAQESERIGQEKGPSAGGAGDIGEIGGLDSMLGGLGDEAEAAAGGESGGLFKPLMEKLSGSQNPLLVSIREQLDKIKADFEVFKPGFIASWNDMFAKITEGQNSFGIGLDLMWQGLLEIIDGNLKVWNGIVSGDWDTVWEGIKEIFRGKWDLIVGILDFALGWLVDLFKFFASEWWDATKKLWDLVWGKVKEVWGNITTYISDKLSAVWNSIKSTWDSIKEKTSSIMSDVWSSITETWDNIKEKISKVASNLWNDTKDGWDTFKDNLKEKIKGWMDIFDVAKDWGKHLMENFAEGVKNSINKVKEEIDDVKDWIKEKLGFSYNKYMPSEIWGKHMVQNFASGIKSAMPDLENSLSELRAISSNGINVPVINTGAVSAPAMAAGSISTSRQQVQNVTSNSGNNYNINTGMMMASPGEIREFVRLINKYQAAEAARKA